MDDDKVLEDGKRLHEEFFQEMGARMDARKRSHAVRHGSQTRNIRDKPSFEGCGPTRQGREETRKWT